MFNSNNLATRFSMTILFSMSMFVTALSSVHASNTYDANTGWSDPVRLDSQSTGQSIVIATDAIGNAVAAWSQVESGLDSYGIWANRYDVKKGWGNPQRITQLLGQRCFPHIAMNDAGVAMITWCQYSPASYDPTNRTYAEPTSVWVSRLNPGAKTWSQPQLVADESGDPAYPVIAIDGQGNAVVAYVQDIPAGEYTVHARYIQANGKVAGDELMQRAGNSYGGTYDVAMNKRGQAMVIWNDVDPNTYETMFVSKLFRPGKGWATAQAVNGTQGNAYYSGLGLDNDGNALLGFAMLTVSPDYVYKNNAFASHYSARMGWESPVLLQSSLEPDAENMVLKMNDRGEAMAIWSEYGIVPVFQMYANHYIPGKGWQVAGLIGERANQPSATHLALDNSGNAVATWVEPMPEFLTPGSYAPPYNVFAFHFDSKTGWDQGKNLQYGPVSIGTVSTAMSRDAFVVWGAGDFNLETMFASHWGNH